MGIFSHALKGKAEETQQMTETVANIVKIIHDLEITEGQDEKYLEAIESSILKNKQVTDRELGLIKATLEETKREIDLLEKALK